MMEIRHCSWVFAVFHSTLPLQSDIRLLRQHQAITDPNISHQNATIESRLKLLNYFKTFRSLISIIVSTCFNSFVRPADAENPPSRAMARPVEGHMAMARRQHCHHFATEDFARLQRQWFQSCLQGVQHSSCQQKSGSIWFINVISYNN